jgi:quercetin dioxygenase-like cupin family protein
MNVRSRFLTPVVVGAAFAAGVWAGTARPELGAATAALTPVFTPYSAVVGGKWMKVAPGVAVAGVSHTASVDFGVVQISSVGKHTHHNSTEYVYVVSGTGTGTLAGKPITVKPGDLVVVPPGVEHSFAASGAPFRFVMTVVPPIAAGDMHMTK